MKKNPNHPRKGSSTLVEPIRRLEDIASIKRLLASRPRDLLLFTIGVNTTLRIADILRLRVGELKGVKIGDAITVHEARSGKMNTLVVNKVVYRALQMHLATTPASDSDYLFRSRKGSNQPLTIGSVNALVKSWTRAINIPGNYGAHSLRKTFGYIQRTHYGVGFDILARQFNHSTPSVTKRYLGISGTGAVGISMMDI